MADFSVLSGVRMGARSTALPASSGSANVKSAWAELIASLSYDADALLVAFGGTTALARYLIDIGIGAGGAEQVLIPNALYQPNFALISTAIYPVAVKAATRISTRFQSSSSSAQPRVSVWPLQYGFPRPASFGRAAAYGVSTTTTVGTQIDPGSVANTKGAYAQLVASTAERISEVVVLVGGQGNTAPTAAVWIMDLAIGAGGAERIVLADQRFALTHASGDFAPSEMRFAVAIPAGSRIAARAECSITDSTDRLFDVALVGFS